MIFHNLVIAWGCLGLYGDNTLKEFTVLRLGELVEFKDDGKIIDSFISGGYKIERKIKASSVGDARIKYEEMVKKAKSNTQGQNQTQKSDNPSGYLNVMSTIFLILSLIGCVAFQVAASRIGGTYLFASSIGWLIITLLIHSACRCLIYITRKQ